MTRDEQIQNLTQSLQEQHKWFSGKVLRYTLANLIATRLYELGWRFGRETT